MEENYIQKLTNNFLQDRNLEGLSVKWANWKSELSIFTCMFCAEQHGKIVEISFSNSRNHINAHFRCRCIFVPMRTIKAGNATNIGYNGADAQLFYQKKLPSYYVSKQSAYNLGWKSKHKHLDKILPGKMIGGDLFYNNESKLPSAHGRTWYEADINYEGGARNRQRILYSSDGLIFVSYDHYQTFYEIVK